MLLHFISNHVPRVDIFPSPWNNLFFASKGVVTCGANGCGKFPTASLHHIGSAIYLPTVESIDAAFVADPGAKLLGAFTVEDDRVNAIHIRKKIYLPVPCVGMFLDRDISPAEECKRL